MPDTKAKDMTNGELADNETIASRLEMMIGPMVLDDGNEVTKNIREAAARLRAMDELKPVAWSIWMDFGESAEGERIKPTSPVFFSEEGAQNQIAKYGGTIVPLFDTLPPPPKT